MKGWPVTESGSAGVKERSKYRNQAVTRHGSAEARMRSTAPRRFSLPRRRARTPMLSGQWVAVGVAKRTEPAPRRPSGLAPMHAGHQTMLTCAPALVSASVRRRRRLTDGDKQRRDRTSATLDSTTGQRGWKAQPEERIRRTGGLADDAPACPPSPGTAAKQRSCVGIAPDSAQTTSIRPFFNDSSEVHHRNAVRNGACHGEVVRDEHHVADVDSSARSRPKEAD